MRPVLLEHAPTKRIDFYLPLDVESGPLKPKIEPADAGKQRPHRHAACSCRFRRYRALFPATLPYRHAITSRASSPSAIAFTRCTIRLISCRCCKARARRIRSDRSAGVCIARCHARLQDLEQ
jgi:hypothetical protein